MNLKQSDTLRSIAFFLHKYIESAFFTKNKFIIYIFEVNLFRLLQKIHIFVGKMLNFQIYGKNR